MTSLREDALHGRWVHSHEEDSGDEMVFRPESYEFPLSRGRTSLELCADGTYVERAPGPADVPEETRGSWALEGDRLRVGSGPGREWEVAAAEADRLVVRRSPPPA